MSKSHRRRRGDKELGRLVHARRLALGLSRAGLAELADIDVSVVHRIESGQRHQPAPSTLEGLARGLELPLADLYSAAGYAIPVDLPSFQAYLRTRYDLPGDEIQRLEQLFNRIRLDQPRRDSDESPHRPTAPERDG